SSLDQETITVVATKAGKQSVTVKVTNVVGTSSTSKEVIDVVDASDAKLVYNVVKGKKVVDYSGSTNSTEVPDRIIDGVTNPSQTSQKWCTLESDRWAIFDCQGAYRIYGFRIYDGNSGPEKGVDQINNYKIMLSNDGKNWTTVVDAEGRVNESIKTDYIPPFKARYVKLVPESNGTLRIWEFEVYGMEDNNMTIEVPNAQMKMNAGETKNIVVKYNLNGDERAESFTCTATSNGGVTIGKITEDKANQTFTIPVTAENKMGTDNVVINVNNGGAYKERIVEISIDATSQPNILTGATAEVRHYKNDYSYEAQYDKFDINGLTDGNKTEEALMDIEDASTHKDDTWAIFTAPKGKEWNLSKVVVNIPNAN
ncbi:discoidin domain-containing protein, partial [Prevotella sp.]|uniref:discoidin domain-containing protein n=1 Tax=Prevotella sp. TaxID=59823 RepID=UPI0025E71147